MKLSEFLKLIEKEFEYFKNMKILFDLGIDTNMNINDKSQNRIKFAIIKKR